MNEEKMTEEEARRLLTPVILGSTSTPGSLRYLASAFGLSFERNYTVSTVPRELLVEKLIEYYCQPGRFEELWNKIGPDEREAVSLEIWSKGLTPADCYYDIIKKYDLQQVGTHYLNHDSSLHNFKSIYTPNDSAFWLISPRGVLLFKKEISAAIGGLVRTYSQVTGELTLISRQNRKTDFPNIVKYCNSNKVTTDNSGTLNKSSSLGLLKYCGYEDLPTIVDSNPEDIRCCLDLMITYPLTTFALIGGLLEVVKGDYRVSEKAPELLKMPHEALVKHIFDSYLNTNSYNENIIFSAYIFSKVHQPCRARQNLIKELRFCPPGQLVYTDEFAKYLCIADPTFARSEKNQVKYDDTRRRVIWDDYEQLLIYIIISFLGALGLLDIAWGQKDHIHLKSKYHVPTAFSLNPLGEYLLGLKDSYVRLDGPEITILG
jgi:hypothetical protein